MIPDIKELNFPKKDGKQYATLSHATVTLADMGEKTISTQVKINGDITPDFSHDWEVEFQGEKYIMPLRHPQGIKENTSLNTTIDLTFQHWAIYQLKRYYFVTLQPIESGTAVADKYIASVSLNLNDFCNLFGQILEYWYGDAITIDLNPAWKSKSEPTNIEISYSYIWDILIKLYELFAVRWHIEPLSGNNNDIEGGERYVIKVGYPTTEVDHIFKYGFEGGLMKVERQVQDENIRNLLLGRGGGKNLPFRYFKNIDPDNNSFPADPDWVPELENIYFDSLRGATFRSYIQGWKARHYGGTTTIANTYAPWAWNKGYTDLKFNPVEYVKDDESIAKYGPILGGLDNNEDIYPTIQGVIVNPYGRIDEAVDIEQIISDDVEESVENDAVSTTFNFELKETTVIGSGQRKTIELESETFNVDPGKHANIDEGPKTFKVSRDFKKWVQYNDKGKWEPHVETFQIEVEDYFVEIENASLVVVNTATGEERSASGIPEGSYYFRLKLTIHNTSQYKLNVVFACEEARLTSATISDSGWGNTFDIWIKNIWETTKLPSENEAQYVERVWNPILGGRDGSDAKVIFSTGMLSTSEDYEFTIIKGGVHYDTSKSFDGISSHWRLTVGKSDADLESIGLYVPNTKRQGKAGDHFFFTGIDMPHQYVLWAEKALEEYKADELTKLKDINPTWVVATDRVRLNNEGKTNALIQQLRIGSSLRLADKRFISGDYEILYIQSLTYTYREASSDDAALNPDVDIVLSNEYATTANPVATIQSDINSLQRQVGSISNIEQIVRTVGDKLYLRKDGISDRSLSPTQFFSLLTSSDFRSGIVGGAGWGFFKDANGNWVLEADRINVRQEMQVNNLVINQVYARGGMEIDTAAFIEVNRVMETTDAYVCYFDQKDGSIANLFRIDDVAYCNHWTPENTELKFYKRRVIAISSNSITLTKGYDPIELSDGTIDTGVNGTGIPAEKDNIIHFGNYTDKTRQYVKVRDVIGGGYERFLDGLDSVNATGDEYYFVGRQAGMYNNRPRWYIGHKSEDYIEWIDGKLNIKGHVSITGGSSGLENFTEWDGKQEQIDDATKKAQDAAEQITEAEQKWAANIKVLQDQVDGVIESFSYPYTPTATNYPASEWDTEGKKQAHVGDVFYNIQPAFNDDGTPNPDAGKAWRWSPDDAEHSGYHWHPIADSDAVKALQLAQMSVTDTDVLYIQSASSTDTPDLPATDASGAITDLKGWSTDAPEWAAGKFIWQTTYVRKGNGSASFSAPTCISGKDGAGYTPNLLPETQNWGPGWFSNDFRKEGTYEGLTVLAREAPTTGYADIWYSPGTDLKNDTVYTLSVWAKGQGEFRTYVYPGVTAQIISIDGVPSTSTAQDTAARHALTSEWKRYFVIFRTLPTGSLKKKYAIPARILNEGGEISVAGAKLSEGADYAPVWTPAISEMTAISIRTITEQYYLSTSRFVLEGGTWSDTRPVWVAGKFYWTRSKITYTDGSVEYAGEICATGEEGKDGRYTINQWAKSNSATSAPTGGWLPTPPAAAAGEYVWMRSGVVVPPATAPASWDNPVRLTGDKGLDGQSVYMLDLSNEVAAIACDAAGNVVGSYPTSKASVYQGSKLLTAGVTYSIETGTGTVTASVSTSGTVTLSNLKSDTATVIVKAVVAGLTLRTTMSVYKVKPGATGTAAVMYSLLPSIDSVTRSMTGTLSAQSVNCTVYKITGNTPRVPTGEKTLKYQRIGVDSSEVTISHSNGTSADITLTDRTEAVIFSLYDGAVLLDRERVPVLSDASDLKVGGINLLDGTHNGSGWTYKPVAESEFRITTSSLKSVLTHVSLRVGNTYTLSFDAKRVSDTAAVNVRIFSSNEVDVVSFDISPTQAWTQYRRTFVFDADRDRKVFLYVTPEGSDVDVSLRNIMLEEGNIVTGYTLSAYDLSRTMDQVSDIVSDSVITPFEKDILQREWLRIQGEYADLTDQAVRYGINYAAYPAAYEALADIVTPVLQYMNSSSEVSASQFERAFATYYAQAKEIALKIAKGIDESTKYLRTAIQNGSTDITGGLVMTSILLLRNLEGVVQAGVSGLMEDEYPFFSGSTYEGRAKAPYNVSRSGAIRAMLGKIGVMDIASNEVTIANDKQGNKIVFRTDLLNSVPSAIAEAGIPAIQTMSYTSASSGGKNSDSSSTPVFSVKKGVTMRFRLVGSMSVLGNGSASWSVTLYEVNVLGAVIKTVKEYRPGFGESSINRDESYTFTADGRYKITATATAAAPSTPIGSSAQASTAETKFTFVGPVKQTRLYPDGIAVVSTSENYMVATGNFFEVRKGNGGVRLHPTSGALQKYQNGGWVNV